MNYNLIINLVDSFDKEQINQIIKIQANIRGMEMRDKIKLKSKKKKQKNEKEEEIIKTESSNINNNEFIYENKIQKEIKENDIELIQKYEELIVIKYINNCLSIAKKRFK